MKKFAFLMLVAVISLSLFVVIQNDTPVNAEPAETQTDGLIGWWKFNDSPDSISDDSSVSNNGGTNNNMSPANSVSDVPAVCSESNVYAISLNPGGQADNQWINVGDHEELRPDSITVAAWIKPTDGTYYGQIAGAAGQTKGTIGYTLAYSGEYNSLEFSHLNGRATFETVGDDAIEGQWAHVAATYDEVSGDTKLYLNGVLVDTEDNSPEVLRHSLDGFADSPYDFEIGRTQNTELDTNSLYEGLIDDVRVYDFALNDSEVEGLSAEGDCGSSLEDLNGDEIPDGEQPNVSGIVSPITDKTVVLEVGDDCELTNDDDFGRESDFAAQDPAYDYVNGLWGWEADCASDTTTVKLYYYDVPLTGLVARKFNSNTNTYSTIPGATIETQTINGQSVTVVTYQIADNGPLDMNPEVGQITDPAGVGTSGGTLSATGSSSLLLISTSIVVLMLGIGIVVFAKRKRRLVN